MRNTGKPSEQAFEDHWATLGKAAYVERLVDAAEIRGRTGRIGLARAQPSDYLLVCPDGTIFAEVKSTIDPKVMKPGLLKTTQRAKATMITSAGGRYEIFIHSLEHDRWYRIPFLQFPKSSTQWKDLETYRWKLMM